MEHDTTKVVGSKVVVAAKETEKYCVSVRDYESWSLHQLHSLSSFVWITHALVDAENHLFV